MSAKHKKESVQPELPIEGALPAPVEKKPAKKSAATNGNGATHVLAEDVPAETKTKVEEVKKGLKDGSFVIWKGPIMGSDGKEILKKDEVADDKFLGGVNFYVKGVEGKVPSGK